MHMVDANQKVVYADTVHGTFEAAHRQLLIDEPKCASWHGHSWHWHVMVASTLLHNGIVVNFGELKAAVGTFVDVHLDHATLAAADDPMVGAFVADGRTKLFRFGAPDPSPAEKLAADLAAPSAEYVGLLLMRIAQDFLADAYPDRPVWVSEVRVSETSRNEACIRPVVLQQSS